MEFPIGRILVFLAAFVINGSIDFEKIVNERLHLVWIIVGNISILGPIFLYSHINGWYITWWYIGVFLAHELAFLKFRSKFVKPPCSIEEEEEE